MSMEAAVWPCVLLGLLAFCIAGSRVYILAWQAPVAAVPLTAALTRHVARGELSQACALCTALAPSWAADCAWHCLQASQERAAERGFTGVALTIEELQASYRQRAQAGLFALQALSRMAFPLALGTAMVVMSGAFVDADVSRVEHALATALQGLTVAVMNIVFCRVSAVIVARQGEARLREIGAVCRGLAAALGSLPAAESPSPAPH
jgi:hypothetical protein